MRTCRYCGGEVRSVRGSNVCRECAVERKRDRRRERDGVQNPYKERCQCGQRAVADKVVTVGVERQTLVRLVMCKRCVQLEMQGFGEQGVRWLAVGV